MLVGLKIDDYAGRVWRYSPSRLFTATRLRWLRAKNPKADPVRQDFAQDKLTELVGDNSPSPGSSGSDSDTDSPLPERNHRWSSAPTLVDPDDEDPVKDESEDPIRERCIKHGRSLLDMSVEEANSPTNDGLERRLYIDSVAYFLRGLPQDLDANEVQSLRRAMPPGLSFANPATASSRSSSTAVSIPRRSSSPPSTLHRLSATAALYWFLAAAFLLPYIQHLCRQAYRYERKYRLSNRIVNGSLEAGEILGRQSLALAGIVCSMDGQIGGAVRDASVRWAQEVAAGLSEGIGRGMRAVQDDSLIDRNLCSK